MLPDSPATNSTNIDFCSFVSIQIAIAISVMRLVLITPVSVFVLYLGHQRWRQQRSCKTVSHSDVFAYHMAALQLLWIPCFCCYMPAYFANLVWSEIIASCLYSIILFGEISFHILTCLERYLAVVHPVTYLGLKNGRIRNYSIGCAWLLNVGLLCPTLPFFPYLPVTPVIVISALSLAVVSFCTVSILCILIQPKPADGGRETLRVEQSKLRAFYTITAIMGVLCLWFVGCLLALFLKKSQLVSDDVSCVLMASASFFNLPSSLVLPVLFLQRAGKLPCCNCNNKRQ